MKIIIILFFAIVSGIIVNAQEKIVGVGTGFPISETLIVTNSHVVEDAEKIYVRGIKGNLDDRVECKLLKSDDDNDIAILEIADENKKTAKLPYGFETNACNQGEWICVIGFPQKHTLDESKTFNQGTVNACKGYATPDKENSFMFDAAVQSGNSGSPVFNQYGDIMGVVSQGSNGEFLSVGVRENFNSAIKIKALIPMLDRLGIDIDFSAKKNKRFKQLSNEEKFKFLKKFIYIIDIQKEKTESEPDSDSDRDDSYDFLLRDHPALENSYEHFKENLQNDTDEYKGPISKLSYRKFKYIDKFTGMQKQTVDSAWIYIYDKAGEVISKKCYDKHDDLLFTVNATEGNNSEIRDEDGTIIWKQVITPGDPVIKQSIYYKSYIWDSIIVSKSECYLNDFGNCKEFVQYNSEGLLYKTTIKYDNNNNNITEESKYNNSGDIISSVTYEYDINNNLVKKTCNTNETKEITTYADNKEVEIENSGEDSDYKMTYSYNEYGDLSEIYYTSDDKTVKMSYSYQYNNNKKPINIHQMISVNDEEIREDIDEYQYDDYGNVILNHSYSLKDGKKTEEELTEYIFEYYQ